MLTKIAAQFKTEMEEALARAQARQKGPSAGPRANSGARPKAAPIEEVPLKSDYSKAYAKAEKKFASKANKLFKLNGRMGAIGAAGATTLGGYALYNKYKNKMQTK